ncbi:hypothetical protein SLA2020_052200 [Shorea laevis]
MTQMEMDACFRTYSSETNEIANASGILQLGFDSRRIVKASLVESQTMESSAKSSLPMAETALCKSKKKMKTIENQPSKF